MDAEQIIKDSNSDPDVEAALDEAGVWMENEESWIKLAAACLDQGMIKGPQVLAAIKAALGQP